MISGTRISHTWFGYVSIALLFIFYALLLTSSTTGEWFSYYLPSLAGIATLLVFCAAIVCKVKLPQLPAISWATISIAGGYFFTRAWFSPDFYGSIEDMLPMAFALIFYLLGVCVGISRGSNRLLFIAALLFIGVNIILLNEIPLFNKEIVLGRPAQSLLLYRVGSIGTFGYANFISQFLVSSSFFCIAYFIFSGIKSWQWLLLGIFGCLAATSIDGARSVYPNIILGSSICWLFLMVRVYSKTKIFGSLVILTGIFLIILTGSILSIITQQGDKLADLTSFSNSSGRFLLSSIIPKISESAPLIGHGAQAFPHVALPLMSFGMMPNMAHNEYAQAVSDYGWIGLSIMTLLLSSHLFLGARLIAQRGILSRQKSIYAAAFILIAIMSFHALFEFIWHNAALTSSAGLCLGILSTANTNQPKAGTKLNNYLLLGLGLILSFGFFSFSKISYPIWDLSWQMDKLPLLKKKEIQAEHLALLQKAVSIAGDSSQTDKLAHIIFNTPELSTASNCQILIPQLINSLHKSPQDDMLKTHLGRAYDQIGDFEKAEALLYPYSSSRYYKTYPWKAIYLKHLTLWAISKFGVDNATALSLLLEADRMYPLQRSFRKDLKNKAEFIKEVLLQRGITPDDSWKKNRTPASFPTSYGPSLPGLLPPQS